MPMALYAYATMANYVELFRRKVVARASSYGTDMQRCGWETGQVSKECSKMALPRAMACWFSLTRIAGREISTVAGTSPLPEATSSSMSVADDSFRATISRGSTKNVIFVSRGLAVADKDAPSPSAPEETFEDARSPSPPEESFEDAPPRTKSLLRPTRLSGGCDRLHGHGTFTWARPMGYPDQLKWRKKYIGWLEDGRIESQACASTFIFNKQVYEGEFRDGVAHGKGVMLWEDGHHYDGEWVDGRAHGDGLLTLVDGTEKKGPFVPCRYRRRVCSVLMQRDACSVPHSMGFSCLPTVLSKCGWVRARAREGQREGTHTYMRIGIGRGCQRLCAGCTGGVCAGACSMTCRMRMCWRVAGWAVPSGTSRCACTSHFGRGRFSRPNSSRRTARRGLPSCALDDAAWRARPRCKMRMVIRVRCH